MLKWAINEPRQSYFPNTPEPLRTCSLNELSHTPTSSYCTRSTRTNQLLKRQSMESVCIEPNKENQVTSTPLLTSSSSPSARQTYKTTPRLRKLDSFRDLSNIYPEHMQNSTPQRQRTTNVQKTAGSGRYASTLPTLDVNEYSPSCALIPGPLLALRGLGIPDAYFEKPRYLTPHGSSESQANDGGATFETPLAVQKLEVSPPKSLSSSQMDESTLERMIDAIIASTHKDHKLPTMKTVKTTYASSRSCSMSPTYTPAYDPASDLDEIWWNSEGPYSLGDADVTLAHSTEAKKYHRIQSTEILLRTPKTHKFQLLNSTFKRRRQRPVRRKRRLTNFRNTVKKSARKLLRVGSNVSTSMPQLYEDDESGEQRSRTNLSRDCGHNSSSGGDSSKTDDHEATELTNKDANEVEVTKRRLSFSKTHCN